MPEDGEEKEEEIKCPECGSSNLLIQGHCVTCLDCGFSLCSL